jgi:epoxyqueuosine reductase
LNYQKELDHILKQLPIQKPALLLHSCCAPCSSYVLEYLQQYFRITVFYFNPNIGEETEYRRRAEEQNRLIQSMGKENTASGTIEFVSGRYEPEEFYRMVKGMEKEKEGGERCFLCYELRLEEAAKKAAEGKFDYFTTTLTISPLKNADKLNEIGQKLAKKYGVSFLPSDFKKKNGYLRSIELSKKYELYRQDYCGCIYSKMQRQAVSETADRSKCEENTYECFAGSEERI